MAHLPVYPDSRVAPAPEPTTVAVGSHDISLLQGVGRAVRPCLIRYTGAEAGARVDLDPGEWLLGRGEGVDVKVEGHGISRHHARLDVSPHGVVLTDLGSANCSYVNEVQVVDPVLLKDGDVVRLANVLFRFHDRHSLDVALHERLHRMSTVDPATGVYNRRFTHETLRLEFAQARRTGTPLALIWCDLDHFKSVNDTHGHAAGDQVLRDSAALLRRVLRAGDAVGRWGGEEFVVIARDTGFEAAFVLAERLRATIAEHPFELQAAEPKRTRHPIHRQTMSVGVAMLVPGMRDEHDLLAAADRRMYAAKRDGRNRVVAFDSQPS